MKLLVSRGACDGELVGILAEGLGETWVDRDELTAVQRHYRSGLRYER